MSNATLIHDGYLLGWQHWSICFVIVAQTSSKLAGFSDLLCTSEVFVILMVSSEA